MTEPKRPEPAYIETLTGSTAAWIMWAQNEIFSLTEERQRWRSRMGLKVESDLCKENEWLMVELDACRLGQKLLAGERDEAREAARWLYEAEDDAHLEAEARRQWPWLGKAAMCRKNTGVSNATDSTTCER